MPERLRSTGTLVLLLALVAYAYAPLMGAGWLGDDLAVLHGLHNFDPAVPGLWYEVQGTEARPGAVLHLYLSRALWTDGTWTGAEAMILRLEHLALLLITAWGLCGVARRALQPWAGSDVARAAGYGAGGFVLLHPLAVAAIAGLEHRGDLLAAAFSAWSARAFLSGRQLEVKRRVVLAWVLAALAGLCSPIAMFLPILLATAEWQSARRHRPVRVRTRTTVTTFVCFGVAVAFEALPRAIFAPEYLRDGWLVPSAASPALWLERLGVLLMPGNVHGLGTAAPLLAALATLLALHPALVAARRAPRLWARVLVGWAAALGLAVAPHAHVRVTPEDLAGAGILFPAAIVMAVGLGTAGAALSGWRRTAIPILVGGLFAILGRAQAGPYAVAAETTSELRADLRQAALDHAWTGTLILLDAPERVSGLDPIGASPNHLLTPALPPGKSAADVRVMAFDGDAFEVWSRGDEMIAIRAGGGSVLVDGEALAVDALPRQAVALLSMGEELERATWVGTGKSPAGLVFDPLRARYLTITALPGADTASTPILRWSSDLPDRSVEATGVWVAGEDTPRAVFDLERVPAWLLGGRVRSVWSPGGLIEITAAVMTPGPPPIHGAVPRPVSRGWSFDLSSADLPAPIGADVIWRLGLFQDGEYTEYAPSEEAGSRLVFRGLKPYSPENSSWYLDMRAGTVTLARASGERMLPAAGD